ncbi:hypothetical protein JIQ42_07738 [Leishmania sp. Namibia]|uniref:hypothetical protein n=1 Tax=Leishmania sp. Namibia TaxID=2802991 RepID=UPI001B5FA106|nr:hypothetical protein JIQ42_07738 [Leishmania sp. Namibia]
MHSDNSAKKMRLASKRHLSAISSHHRYTSTSSSSCGAFGESSEGGASSCTADYSYDSEEFSSYYTSSVLTSPSAATTTAAATVSFSSTVDSSPTNALLDVLTPLSAYSHPSTTPSRAVTRSAASFSDAVGNNTAKDANGSAVANDHSEGVAAAVAWRSASAAATTNSGSVPADDTGTRTRTHQPPSSAPSRLSGSAAAGRSPMVPAALVPFSKRSAAAVALDPNRFSEEKMVRHPWSPVDRDATTRTIGEGGDQLRPGRSVLDTLHTVPVASPPPEEAQRRRGDGRLSYPSHITYRIVPIPSPVHRSDGVVGEGRGGDEKGSWGGKRDPTTATAARERKTSFTFCGFFRRCLKARRNTDDRAAMRQRPHYRLRSHHVPLVNFRTTRAPGASTEGFQNTLASAEEAAGYRRLRDDMMSAEVLPKRLERANHPLNRPPSGLRPNVSFAFGPQADGELDGNGRFIFMRGGDSQGYWIAHLRELASVRLEPIEIE